MTENPFDYRQPTERQTAVMKAVNVTLKEAYEAMTAALNVSSAEQTLAVRKLQEARMWFNCAVVMAPEAFLSLPALEVGE